MRIYRNGKEILTKTYIRWGGDYQQAARTLSFVYLPMEESTRVGDKITMYDDNNNLLFHIHLGLFKFRRCHSRFILEQTMKSRHTINAGSLSYST